MITLRQNYTEGFPKGSGTYHANDGMIYIHYSGVTDFLPMDEENYTDTYHYSLSGSTLQISWNEATHWDFVILYKTN